MAYEGNAKVQHYVPRFLLRNFGTGKKDKLHVFDKKTGESFKTNVKNVAAESRFYDFHVNQIKLTIEPSLGRIESAAKPIIKDILEGDSLGNTSAQNRAKLCVFLAVQFLRTRWFREYYKDLPRQLSEHLRQKHGEDADLTEIADYIRVPDDSTLSLNTATFIQRNYQEFAKQFANKIWALAATDETHSFIIGDHPIGLQNRAKVEFLGNLGLAVKGIEIYFPLSPRRALAMWCPTLVESFHNAVMNDGSRNHGRDLLNAISSGAPCFYSPENVLNFNSLQIAHAERFIFSSTGDFSLATRLIEQHPDIRKGPRSSVN